MTPQKLYAFFSINNACTKTNGTSEVDLNKTTKNKIIHFAVPNNRPITMLPKDLETSFCLSETVQIGKRK
jgi:hypothetical protein